MTSSIDDQSSQLMMQPDPKAKSRRRRAEFWQICWLISLSSLLISIYSIILVQRLAPAASQHDLDQSALVLAQKIASLSIVHNRFGRVGILDIAEGQYRQMSFNRLQATLRLDAMAARKLGFDSMLKLVEQDAREADSLAREFAVMEHGLIKGGSGTQSAESFESLVRRELEKSGVAGRLKSLQISLGGLKNKTTDSGVPLPAIPEEHGAFYAAGDDYAVHVPVPITADLSYEFYEGGQSAGLVPARQFVPCNEKSIASVVLVEAVFEVSERGRKQGTRKLQSCALIASPQAISPASVLMLSFPQGYLSKVRSINDLFGPDLYRTAESECLQAVDGEIPGQGHLMRASGASGKMTPSQAAMQTLYHFIFQIGPELVPARLQELLNKPMAALRKKNQDKSEEAFEFNSGLFKDTGAGRFALMKQSASGQSGQKSLARAFSGKPFAELSPAYAFPLAVDEGGKVRLCGDDDFDMDLLKDFLEKLYQTNISGIESMEVASNIARRMQGSINNSEKKIAELREELGSLKRSLHLLESNTGEPNKEKRAEQFSKQITKLEQEIAAEEARKNSCSGIRSRASLVEQNGRLAARSTYEIGAHMSSFAARGLKRINGPYKGYLLSRKISFIPQSNPVDEDDLYSPEDERSDDEAKIQDSSKSWLSKHFKVTDIPDTGIVVEGQTITEFWQRMSKARANKPFFVFLSSRDLSKTNKEAKLYASEKTPFDNGAISNLQLCYFASRAIESGENPKVSWSFLIRDLAYSMLQDSGSPLYSINPHWCSEAGMSEDSCPGLAAEIQIRTPMTELGQALSGTYLQDPDGGPSIALYPPLPADLL